MFGYNDYEEVWDCPSCRIDTLENVVANNLPMWKIVNKYTKKVS